ncbi:MAG: 2-oxoglutarate/2-oxoacid ferredoxin oxidoreductase subunit beta [Actinomycetota bacterium]|jgi:2-oxoglutarate ferredoxin oxidoreductase subunit beta|nr:2-oxoglutarate/2-oxoacid ferredoxin oxidoreductase subunit beta [Frankiaceae bacterium]MDT7544128.1 2-oxoglutarate/2-oxoacid ferredoxin oxidoreductase subunit beta [Actinomycetota bacterium]MDT7549163.1 2-oxoglutarate/2-oxoacid ferredoxin oxidoreductase subunit beta [Actinomycetota bacterium]
MPSIAKPLVPLQHLQRNDLGLTVRDYEGAPSTLCGGCGHDSVTAALIEALFKLGIPPHKIAKLSGIGCSSKTPAYFVRGAHGFNSVHGRMATIATGANAANRELTYVGISGDGDSLSIGLGHLAHAIRRNINMLYVIENNGVYGLTKGQFSASADINSKSKKGEPNLLPPIDPIVMALSLGATFVARAFSGDKDRLIPILQAGLSHKGFALIDVISPCIQFNDHEGSTKSYLFTRQHEVTATDFVPPREEIVAAVPDEGAISVTMHDGTAMRFRAVPEGYDPTDRQAVARFVEDHRARGEVVTGLLYADDTVADLHDLNKTPAAALASVTYDRLCPGSDALVKLQASFR